MGTTVSLTRSPWDVIARKSLKASVWFWFLIVMAGNMIFAIAITIFYGIKLARGDLAAWNRVMTHGYISSQPMGNVVVGVHIASAAALLVAGTIQFIPQIRARMPALHRWTGRLYILSAFTLSLAGLYMMWFRGTVGDFSQHVGNSVLAIVIMICAFQAVRYARARRFETHRRWAIRLFIAVSASLVIRASFFLSSALAGGPFGTDPATFTGPFPTFISFAQYLVPLAVFEIYLRARNRGAAIRIAMATCLVVITLSTGAGLAIVTTAIWVPDITAGLDPRRSMTGILAAAVKTSGIDSAIQQYNALKASQSADYNFDEPELNTLGYTILRLGKFADAIRIFQLNVQEYPSSANTYDSLGEAYMDAGDKPLAIANYQQSLDRNPKNGNAVAMLGKLKAK